ncbi:MAG: hypothetical protein PHG06_02705 [Parabacteroides sp.]|nr:hypothetical protein [Parabacteroides sp.]
MNLLKKIAVPALLLLISSCSNEENTELLNKENSNSKQICLCNISFENKNGTLSFSSKEQMIDLSKKISTIPIITNRIMKDAYSNTNINQVLALKEAGFTSLYDTYIEAMNEADYYYEKKDGYEEFKSKFSSLYFPEEGDDYSAYLPISDENLSKIADKDGNVIINGEITSLKDITSYSQLRKLGLTPPQTNILKATSGVNGISEEKNGKNKVWVNCHNTKDNLIPVVKVEVCFRKKNFMGVWYNHNSGSEARLDKGAGIDLYARSIVECFGFSPHNYFYARKSIDGINKMPVERDIIINHHGTKAILTLHVSYPIEIL